MCKYTLPWCSRTAVTAPDTPPLVAHKSASERDQHRGGSSCLRPAGRRWHPGNCLPLRSSATHDCSCRLVRYSRAAFGCSREKSQLEPLGGEVDRHEEPAVPANRRFKRNSNISISYVQWLYIFSLKMIDCNGFLIWIYLVASPASQRGGVSLHIQLHSRCFHSTPPHLTCRQLE